MKIKDIADAMKLTAFLCGILLPLDNAEADDAIEKLSRLLSAELDEQLKALERTATITAPAPYQPWVKPIEITCGSTAGQPIITDCPTMPPPGEADRGPEAD